MSEPFTDGAPAQTALTTPPTPPEPQASSQTPAAPPADPAAPAAPQAPQQDAQASSDAKLEELPESWQKEIKSLRAEAARYRKANKDHTDPEADDMRQRIAALEVEIEDRRAAEALAVQNAEKTRILANHGLDPKFLPMLTGDNADAWGKAADSLVELRGAGAQRPDPVQAAGQSTNQDQLSDKDREARAFFSSLDR